MTWPRRWPEMRPPEPVPRPTPAPLGVRLTGRLRLEPVGPEHAEDLVVLHRDEVVATWYAGAWSNLAEAIAFAAECRRGWLEEGVSKWMVYERLSGRLLGRGGMTRMVAEGDSTVQIEALVGGSGWVVQRLELGWALLSDVHGRGYATEIGREALTFAREILAAQAVISYTERCNVASRRVAERLGMDLVGEIRAEGLVEGRPGIAADAPFAVYLGRLG